MDAETRDEPTIDPNSIHLWYDRNDYAGSGSYGSWFAGMRCKNTATDDDTYVTCKGSTVKEVLERLAQVSEFMFSFYHDIPAPPRWRRETE